MKISRHTKKQAKQVLVFIRNVLLTGITIGLLFMGMTDRQSMAQPQVNKWKESMNRAQIEAVFSERLPEASDHKVKSLTKHLIALCNRYDFDPAFVMSVIHTESSFKPEVVSFKGAVGLMQIKPSTAAYIAKKRDVRIYRSKRDLHNPYVNLSLGVAYLDMLRTKFRHTNRFIAAYNLGPGTVGRMVRQNAFKMGAISKYVYNIKNGVAKIRLQSKRLLADNNPVVSAN